MYHDRCTHVFSEDILSDEDVGNLSVLWSVNTLVFSVGRFRNRHRVRFVQLFLFHNLERCLLLQVVLEVRATFLDIDSGSTFGPDCALFYRLSNSVLGYKLESLHRAPDCPRHSSVDRS